MEQRRIARKHLHAGGSCWPSNFGLVTSEPRLWSVFSWLSTMECPGRVSVTRQGARFLKRRAFVPVRALKWQGCFWFIKVDLPRTTVNILQDQHDPVFRICQQLADLPRSPWFKNLLPGSVFERTVHCSFVMANLAFTTVTIRTGDFSNVHNFVKNFVWDPIQSTYCSKSRGASFATKKVRK